MDIEGDFIWGDNADSHVFTHIHNSKMSVIFRFSINPALPLSLPTCIVNCFHKIPVKDAHETFENRAAMRKAIYSSIRRIWHQCASHPSIAAPDVTIESYEDAEQEQQWRISHEGVYNQYIRSLLPVTRRFPNGQKADHAYDTVDYSSLVHISHPGGRGRVAVVHSKSNPDALYVFKGADFGAFLEGSTKYFEHRKDDCYHEIRITTSVPHHPNIVSPPSIFVTVRSIENDQEDLVCGTLYPYLENGTIDDQIQNAKAAGKHLGLVEKARWCFQMSSAIAHTHHKALTYHMDIKPTNFLVDNKRDLILIDWEQGGAPLCTLAPEADGTWDVALSDSESPRLVYEKYSGPHRENLGWSRPTWNVFPVWRTSCPRALEAVEVFSLGRTMWMLLEEVELSAIEHLEQDQVVVSWSNGSEGIPDEWKAVITRCLDPDPEERIRLTELVTFWEAADVGRK